MYRTPATLFSLLLLAFLASTFLCFQAQALSSTSADSPGVIDIHRDPQGLYIKADLAYFSFGPRPKRDPPLPETVKMMVSLSNSETLLVSGCLNFTEYDYLDYNWLSNRVENNISYPSFLAPSTAGFSYVLLDFKYWGLVANSVFLAKLNACQTNTPLVGLNRYGVLGLGSHKIKGNIWASKRFSVFIEPDLSAGKLIFTDDINNYAKSSKPVYQLPTNSDWWLLSVSGSIGVKNFSAVFKNISAIFDINSDAIGLPFDLFTLFMSYFVNPPGVSCNSDLYRPSCNSIGSIQDLPDITLLFNNTKIRIPPKVYATPNVTNHSSFKLNFKATSPDLSGFSYVTPAFKDSIILDAHFMSYYFIVFDATSNPNMVSLYSTVSDPLNGNGFQRLGSTIVN